jgi:5'-nucleotidase
VAVDVLPLLLAAPRRSAINLNVPALDHDDLRGVRWARLAPFGAVRAAVSSNEDGKVQFELVASDHTPDPDTDVALLAEGYATLTALVGVTEAWSSILGTAGESLPEVHEHVVPGAPLLSVHEVPGGHDWSLHRPVLGEDVTGA